jgi:hypothetical protein
MLMPFAFQQQKAADVLPVTAGLLRNFDASVMANVFTGTTNRTTPVTASGQAASCWADLASSLDATQSIATTRPVWTANLRNGLGGLQFDGTDDWMTGADTGMTTGSGNRTAFFVVEWRTVTGTFGGWSYGVNASSQTWGQTKTNFSVIGVQTWVTDYNSTYPIVASTPFVYAAKVDTLNIYHFVNNVAKGSAGYGSSTTLQNLRIGSERNALAPFQPMNAYQILFYNRALTTQETTDVQTYLMNKWGIA